MIIGAPPPSAVPPGPRASSRWCGRISSRTVRRPRTPAPSAASRGWQTLQGADNSREGIGCLTISDGCSPSLPPLSERGGQHLDHSDTILWGGSCHHGVPPPLVLNAGISTHSGCCYGPLCLATAAATPLGLENAKDSAPSMSKRKELGRSLHSPLCAFSTSYLPFKM